MNKQRRLLVVSGPSGSGKDTVINSLAKKYSNIHISVSATTRAMRAGEADGVNYYYLTQQQFEQKIAENEMLEYAKYCENYYGTPRSEVDKNIDEGKTVVLVIEVQGAEKIKQIYPDCTSVFITTPSFDELASRLRGRGTEDEASVQKRLNRAKEEMEYAPKYDFTVVNKTIDDCVEKIYSILKQRQQ